LGGEKKADYLDRLYSEEGGIRPLIRGEFGESGWSGFSEGQKARVGWRGRAASYAERKENKRGVGEKVGGRVPGKVSPIKNYPLSKLDTINCRSKTWRHRKKGVVEFLRSLKGGWGEGTNGKGGIRDKAGETDTNVHSGCTSIAEKLIPDSNFTNAQSRKRK